MEDCSVCGGKQVRLDDGKTPQAHTYPADCISSLAARIKKLEARKTPC